ncbi:MAG: hypothetical protein JNJ41_09335 [Bacteroidia bacterium]|nr:hypothetical protein [Bacteroidia bacterium]
MKKIIYLAPLFFLFIFQACSWQESFVITNQTSADIIIEYEILSPETGFGIFDAHPSSYALNTSNSIDWNKQADALDQDTAKYIVKIVLPPKKALIIGQLSNDHYKSHDQYFINGRTFNLKKLKIQNDKTVIEISSENFDTYFSKKEGAITLRIKK